MSPDPDPMDWKRLAVTGLGVGTAATLSNLINTKLFPTAPINAKWIKIILGYLGINYGDRAGKNVLGENLPDFGAGVLLDGARDLVVEYIVPQLRTWLGLPALTAQYGWLNKNYPYGESAAVTRTIQTMGGMEMQGAKLGGM